VAQTRALLGSLGLGRHVARFVRCGVGYEKMLFGEAGPPGGSGLREEQMGGERSWVAERYAMAAWGLDAAERRRLLQAMPAARAKWTRSRKLIAFRAQKVKRQFAGLEAKAREVFEAVDTDGSGTISQAKFRKLLVSLGIGMGPKQLKETFRWMDTKNASGQATRGTADLDGVIDFDEFFKWWRDNRDGTAARGLLPGGGLTQQAVADGVMTRRMAQATSVSAFAGLFAEGSVRGSTAQPHWHTRPRAVSPAPLRNANGALALPSAVERMRSEAQSSRPVSGAIRKASRGVRPGTAGAKLTPGLAAGSGTSVSFSNACVCLVPAPLPSTHVASHDTTG
jgi:Ca2+-binding EF-hand superfamily protein